MASVWVFLFGAVFMGLGGLSMRRAFTIRKRANLVEETPTEDVESVSMGQSEVTGVARPTDQGTIPAPMSDDECLLAVWEVKELSTTDDGKKWRRQGNGLDAVPFLVDDGTGQALVRPSEDAIFELDEDDEPQILVEGRESPPPEIANFLERDGWRGYDLQEEVWQLGGDSESTEGYSSGDRLYRQHLLQPGDDVYVFGVAQPREDVRSSDNPANVVFQKVPDEDADLEDMFLISDKDEEEIVDTGGRAIKWYGAGILLAMIGFGILLFSILGT